MRFKFWSFFLVTILCFGIFFVKQNALAVGYSYVRSITIDHTKVSNSDLSNFPVLVSSTDTTLRTTGNGGACNR